MARPNQPLTDARRDELDAMIRANIGLAWSESRRWGSDLDDDERLSAGLAGLMRGCERFNPKRGTLGTAVSWHVRAACTLARYRAQRGNPNRDRKQSKGRQQREQFDRDRAPASSREHAENAEETERTSSRVNDLLSSLTPMQRYVIECRFGLSGLRRRTLKAISEAMGLSRERVRQIQVDAIALMGGKPTVRIRKTAV